MNYILYNQREVPVIGHWSTVIIGAGAAGISAGISSAKGNISTLIIDKNISVGGTAVNALVTPMMKSFTNHHSNFREIENALLERGSTTRDVVFGDMLWFSPEELSYVMEKLYTDLGGELLYDAVLADCIVENGIIKYVVVVTVEGLVAVSGENFVDASGDAVLARAAKVPVTHGDENGNNQISSLRFEVGGIDIERYRAYLTSINDTYSKIDRGDLFESAMVDGRDFALEPLFKKGVNDGVLMPEDLHYFQNFSIPGKPGCMSFNCPHLTEMKDNTKAANRSAAIKTGHKMIDRIVKFLRLYMPGFENSYLIQRASMLGIRESFRIVGKYVLAENEYTEKARFDDAVARGDWYIDVHSATKSLYHQNTYERGDYYEIPYRAMVTDSIDNLVVAGRCISTTFLMQASIRIIPTCIDIGQALPVYSPSKTVFCSIRSMERSSSFLIIANEWRESG